MLGMATHHETSASSNDSSPWRIRLRAGSPGAVRKGGAASAQSVQSFLPQVSPSETNRISHPTGFSIVCPPGWTTRTIPIQSFLKDWVSDQFELEGTQKDQYRPKITIQLLGAAAGRQWNDALKPGWTNSDGYALTSFQGQSAFKRFLPGYGKARAVRGTYQPWLSQQLIFKSQGRWFSLAFVMRNANQDKPFYTQPLKIIQDYFETFHYSPSGN